MAWRVLLGSSRLRQKVGFRSQAFTDSHSATPPEKKNGRQLAPPAVQMRPVDWTYLPASSVPSSVKPTARSAAMETAAAVGACAAAKSSVTMESALRSASAGVAMKSALRPANVRVSMEALEALAPVKRRCSVKVSAALEAVESGMGVAVETLVAAEILPSAAMDVVIAPVVAVMVVAPAVMIVEIEPSAVVERKYRSAVKCGTVKPVEPGTGADKHPAVKPFRAVVAVWRARVRRVRIIAVPANRRRTNHYSRGPYSDPNRHRHVGAGGPCGRPRHRYKKSNQCRVF